MMKFIGGKKDLRDRKSGLENKGVFFFLNFILFIFYIADAY